jgi:hypothetical protein
MSNIYQTDKTEYKSIDQTKDQKNAKFEYKRIDTKLEYNDIENKTIGLLEKIKNAKEQFEKWKYSHTKKIRNALGDDFASILIELNELYEEQYQEEIKGLEGNKENMKKSLRIETLEHSEEQSKVFYEFAKMIDELNKISNIRKQKLDIKKNLGPILAKRTRFGTRCKLRSFNKSGKS